MAQQVTVDEFEDSLARMCAPTLLGAKPANMFTFTGCFVDATSQVRACDDDETLRGICPGERDYPCTRDACPCAPEEEHRAELAAVVQRVDQELSPEGVRVRVIAWRAFGAIVLAYRPQLLTAQLCDDQRTLAALAHLGYPVPRGAELHAGVSAEPTSESAMGCDVVSHGTVPAQDALYGADQHDTARGTPTDTLIGTPTGASAISLDALLTHLTRRFAMKKLPHEIGFFLGYPYEDVEGFVLNHGRNYRYCGCWKVYGDPRPAVKLFARYRRCARRCVRLRQSGVALTDIAAGPQRCVAARVL